MNIIIRGNNVIEISISRILGEKIPTLGSNNNAKIEYSEEEEKASKNF